MTQQENDIELDDRMSEECKTFILNSFKKLRPNDSLKFDLKILRHLKDSFCSELNKSVNFDQLNITEFVLTNPIDKVEIQVNINMINILSNF